MLSLVRATAAPWPIQRGIGRPLVSSATARGGAAAAVATPEVEARGAATVGCGPAAATTTGAPERSGAGAATRTRLGMAAKPTSISRITSALREALDLPPNTATITRSLPRSAEETRLKPAALVYPVLMPSAPG